MIKKLTRCLFAKFEKPFDIYEHVPFETRIKAIGNALFKMLLSLISVIGYSPSRISTNAVSGEWVISLQFSDDKTLRESLLEDMSKKCLLSAFWLTYAFSSNLKTRNLKILSCHHGAYALREHSIKFLERDKWGK